MEGLPVVESIAITEATAAGDRRRAPTKSEPLYAAVDLGTNNCRLLIARRTADGFEVVDAFSRIVRLGEGVGATGRLQPAAIHRTMAALRICAGKIRRQNVILSRAVATEACRQASNFPTFRDRVRRETGIELEMIPAGEEARLAAAGCAPLLDPAVPHAIIFDIGGGSTELTWLEFDSDGHAVTLDAVSIPFGVVSLAEQHGGHEVSAETYEAMSAATVAALAEFEARNNLRGLIAQGRVQMIGSSGTVTTLAGVHLGLPRYIRSQVDGCTLTFEEARGASRMLLGLDYAARAAYPCIGRDRADLVLAGCAILEAICETWPVGRLRVGDRGVREGILFDLLAEAQRRHAAKPSG
jgi:exopolyphosphatase/guanosine-5'-triphosphate,3'-diphosphate pyrophosphatase